MLSTGSRRSHAEPSGQRMSSLNALAGCSHAGWAIPVCCNRHVVQAPTPGAVRHRTNSWCFLAQVWSYLDRCVIAGGREGPVRSWLDRSRARSRASSHTIQQHRHPSSGPHHRPVGGGAAGHGDRRRRGNAPRQCASSDPGRECWGVGGAAGLAAEAQGPPADLRSASGAGTGAVAAPSPEGFGFGTARWTLQDLATAAGTTGLLESTDWSSVWRLLLSRGPSWKQSKRRMSSPDPEYEERRADRGVGDGGGRRPGRGLRI